MVGSSNLELWQVLNFTGAALNALQFWFSAFQLFLIFYFGHKKASYQSYFLIICLVETAFRVVFYATYSQPFVGLSLHPTAWLILYWLPLQLQFAMFSLVVLFFAQVIHQDQWPRLRRYFLSAWFILNFVLLGLLIACLVPSHSSESEESVAWPVDRKRELIAAFVFAFLAILIGYYGLRLSRMIAESKVQLHATSITAAHIKALTVLLVSVFTVRFLFNLVSVVAYDSFSARVAKGTVREAVITFIGMACELVAIFAITFFFRHIPNPVQPEPASDPLVAPNLYINSYTRGLFQNPNRYDEFGEDVTNSYEGCNSYGGSSRQGGPTHPSARALFEDYE